MILAAMLLAQAAAAPESVARGEKIFTASCAVGYCHGAAGAASRGPRLRGRSFTHDYLYKVTSEGIPNSAMPPWKGRLSDPEIRDVVAYIASLSEVSGAPGVPSAAPPPSALHDFDGPPEVLQGRRLFFDSTRAVRCANCHSMGGLGSAIGPNLARSKSPELPNKTRLVGTARLKGGESFPALLVDKTPKQVKLYDLSSPFPVLRSVPPSSFAGWNAKTTWRHQTAARGYSEPELKSILSFVRWSGFK